MSSAFVVAIGVGVVALCASARDARACEFVIFELRTTPADVRAASVAGLWWLPTPALTLETADGGVDVDVVIAGPNASAYRVPDLAPGDYVGDGAAGFGRFTLTVTDDAAPAAGAPELRSVDVETSRVIEQTNPCSIGFSARTETSSTAVTLDFDADGDDANALVDVWLLPPDTAPDETAPRLIELASSTLLVRDGAVGFDVDDGGSFDVHVRLTDVRTGLQSQTLGVGVIHAPPAFAGWDILGGWHWGCAAAADGAPVVLALALFARRRFR